MTVKELIDKLELLEDKEAKIYWCKPSEDSKKLGEYNIIEFEAGFYGKAIVSMVYL